LEDSFVEETHFLEKISDDEIRQGGKVLWQPEEFSGDGRERLAQTTRVVHLEEVFVHGKGTQVKGGSSKTNAEISIGSFF